MKTCRPLRSFLSVTVGGGEFEWYLGAGSTG
jgi:hypothetical protein